MGNIRRVVLVALAVIFAAALGRAGHAAEMRFALVVGNDEYKSAKLATPANDAGLVANALQAAGFTVTGARNLDQSTLRETFREFVDQLAAAGPDVVAFVYLAGFGLQFEGENYFVPVDADPQRDVDIPLQTVRISDLMQPLAALPGHVKILVLDAARQNEFARGGQPLAGGLALVEPARGTAVAFNAAPGTVAPDEQGPYGAYATSLAEMIAAGGLGLDDVFARIRLRVSELTNGGEIPWYASQIEGPFFFTDRVADAPPPPQAVPLADLRSKPMRGYSSVEDAYEAALAMDTMEAYEQFLVVYPDSPFARRISAMLAVRREEIIWRRSVMADTPQAYWSYLHRYPRGPHVWDARRRLARLGGAMEPPPSFAYVDFGVPPPPPLELELIAAPVLILWGTHFAPPPPPPVVFLPPRPREFAALPPPPAARQRFALPAPAAPVVPAFVRPPRTVAPAAAPPGAAPTGAAPPGGRPATTVALPAAVQKRENSGAPGTNPAAPGAAPSSAAVTPAPVPPPPSSTAPATVKPGRRPPTPPATSPAPATVKPGTPPPPPPATEPAPAIVKPGTPPPPATAPAPATVKPGTPPPPATSPAPAAVKPGKPPTPPSATEPAPATVKPATPPSPPTSPAPATVKPAAPPPPPPAAAAPKPTTVKPAAPPPPPPAAAPKPTTVKPPPPPPPPAAAPKPAAAKPAPPPPPPPASAPAPAAAKPACPPGKTLAQVNGHPTCK